MPVSLRVVFQSHCAFNDIKAVIDQAVVAVAKSYRVRSGLSTALGCLSFPSPRIGKQPHSQMLSIFPYKGAYRTIMPLCATTATQGHKKPC